MAPVFTAIIAGRENCGPAAAARAGNRSSRDQNI